MAVTLPDMVKAEAAIVEMTNVFRRENKLAEVRPNAKLTAIARSYAAYLAQSDTFSHTADGRSTTDRVKSGGYSFCLVAENLALNLDSRGFETRQLASQSVEGWKRSPGHRRNLLAEHVTEIGVGIAKSPDKEQYLSVQVFGRPDSLRYTFVVRNQAAATVRYSLDAAPGEIKPGYEVQHSACKSARLEFIEARDGRASQALTGRYDTREGDAFVLHATADGRVTVDHVRNAAPAGQGTGALPAR